MNRRTRRVPAPSVPPLPLTTETPAASAPSSAADGPALLAEVASLRERVAALERERLAGGAERKLSLDEIAARLNHAPSTLRAWARDPDKADLYRLDLLLVTSPLPSREVWSTPRLLAQWEDHCQAQMRRVLWGGGLRPGERIVGHTGRR